MYKAIFNKSGMLYIRQISTYLIITIITIFITFEITNIFPFSNIYFKLFANVIICIVISNMFIFIIFRNNKYFKYYIDLLKKLFELIKDKFKMVYFKK